jgi:hypothetical protein
MNTRKALRIENQGLQLWYKEFPALIHTVKNNDRKKKI